MYEEITKYANSIRTLGENEATAIAQEIGNILSNSSLADCNYHQTLADHGIEDPWLADAESIDGETVIAILSRIRDSDFWCAGSWRSTVRSGYLERLLNRLVEIDADGTQTDPVEPGAMGVA